MRKWIAFNVLGVVALIVCCQLLMTSPARASVVADTFDAATLDPMWVLDDEPASYSGGGFSMQPATGIARFDGVGNNAFAHIESATTYDTTGGIRTDATMRQDHYPVQTWGMAVAIYFDANNYVALKQSAAGGASGWLRHLLVNGSFSQQLGNTVSDLRTSWLISGIELTATQIKFYGSAIGPNVDKYGVTDIDANVSEIAELAVARPASFTGNATIIIGKGWSSPHFDNSAGSDSYAFAGIDYARIIVVPEPATIGLLLSGGILAMYRRSRV